MTYLLFIFLSIVEVMWTQLGLRLSYEVLVTNRVTGLLGKLKHFPLKFSIEFSLLILNFQVKIVGFRRSSHHRVSAIA
jgi:hypothetical protein